MIDNRIGGDWVAPASGCYLSLGYSAAVSGETLKVQVARSGAEDVQRALGASHRAAGPWGAASVWGRTRLLRQMPWRLRERRLELFIGDLAERGGLDPGGCHPRGALLRLWLGALVGASATREGPGPGPAVRGASGVTTLALPAADPPSAGLGRLVCLLGGGCTVVCAVLYARRRPADAWTSALLCAVSACLPPGALNVVHGLGIEAGAPLVSAPLALSASGSCRDAAAPPPGRGSPRVLVEGWK
jgi:aldehyde dehydrogenase